MRGWCVEWKRKDFFGGKEGCFYTTLSTPVPRYHSAPQAVGLSQVIIRHYGILRYGLVPIHLVYSIVSETVCGN